MCLSLGSLLSLYFRLQQRRSCCPQYRICHSDGIHSNCLPQPSFLKNELTDPILLHSDLLRESCMVSGQAYTYHFTGVTGIEHNLALNLNNASAQGTDIVNGARNLPDQVTLPFWRRAPPIRSPAASASSASGNKQDNPYKQNLNQQESARQIVRAVFCTQGIDIRTMM